MQLKPTYSTYRNEVVPRPKPPHYTDLEKAEIIHTVVAKYINVSKEVLSSKWRKREVTEARQIGMTITKLNTSLSLKTIGRQYGGRDHSTVCSARDTVFDLSDTDPDFLNKVRRVQRLVEDYFILTSRF